MSALHCPAMVTLRPADLKATILSGIYFIQQGEVGPIKIGWSKNVRSRIATLKTASPYRLRLLLVLKGEEHDERRLHDWFHEERLNGEWFRVGGELEAFVIAKAARVVDHSLHYCDGRKPSEPCWGNLRRYSIDDDWFCEGHWQEREGHGFAKKPPVIHPPAYANDAGQACCLASKNEPCWGEISRLGDADDTYCEAHNPVDGVYRRIAEGAAVRLWSSTADQEFFERDRVDTLLASLGGD